MTHEKYPPTLWIHKYSAVILVGFIICLTLAIIFLVLYLIELNANQTPNTQMLSDQERQIVEQTTTKLNTMRKTTMYDSTENPFDKFDRIYYINMDTRQDRKYELESELRKMNIAFTKVQRIPGIKDKFGALGCSKAHLNALLDCQSRNLKNCLILEDDFMFKFGRDSTYSQLNKFWDLHIQWDVLLLSCFTRKHEKTSLDFLIRVTEGQTTAGYAVNQHFLPVLIENFQKGIAQLELQSSAKMEFCIDQYWKKLQETNKWYTFHPVLAHQRDTFSDIEQKDVNYNDKYEVVKEIDQIEYIICVKTCLPRLQKNEQQLEALNQLSKKYNIRYFFYYGDPACPTAFSIDEEKHIIVLRCKDDYLNLCHKFGMMVYFLKSYITLNATCQNLKGVFFTDDDIDINAETFYNFVKTREDIEYWGYVTKHEKILSNHLIDKAKESPNIKQMFTEQYPELLEYKISVNLLEYCPGGGFYLTVPTLSKLSLADDLFLPFPTSEGLQFHKVTQDGGITCFKELCIFDDYNVGVALNRFNIKPQYQPIQEIVDWPGLRAEKK